MNRNEASYACLPSSYKCTHKHTSTHTHCTHGRMHATCLVIQWQWRYVRACLCLHVHATCLVIQWQWRRAYDGLFHAAEDVSEKVGVADHQVVRVHEVGYRRVRVANLPLDDPRCGRHIRRPLCQSL
jgi:hypothetical protein